MVPALSVEVVGFASLSDDLGEQWDALARREGTYFHSRAWLAAWSAELEPTAEIEVVAVRTDHGVLVGGVAVARQSRRVHRRVPLRLPFVGLAGGGTGAADHVGPLASTDDIARLLARAVVDRAGGRTIYLEHLDLRWVDTLRAELGASETVRTPCPRLSRQPGARFEDCWPVKVRKNVRRRDRMLAEEGVTERWLGPGSAELLPALRSLQDLHTQRWRERGQPGLFDERRLAFLGRLSRSATGEEGPWLLLLEGPDAPVGALLCFRFGATLSVYKTGWDPTWARFGIGVALGARAMRRAETWDVTTLDYLRGGGGHKYAFGAVDHVDVSLIRPRGVTGRLLRAREVAGAPKRHGADTSASLGSSAQ